MEQQETESGKILGTNNRYYPNAYGAPIRTCTVLVSGAIGDYAAYTGHGTPEWVRDHGDKISFKEASSQFMGLVEDRYRL